MAIIQTNGRLAIVLNLFKKYDLETIKHKFIIIYLLNTSDIFFTLLLLRTGKFYEGNAFMRTIVNNETVSVILKLGAPIVLLYVIFVRMKAAADKQLLKANILINACTILYAAINFSHLFWLTSLYIL